MEAVKGNPVPTDVFGRRFYYLALAISLIIGALQMYRIRVGVVTDYGADFFGTIWLYSIFRQGRSVFQRRRPMPAVAAAVFVFVGCTASELAQKVHWLPGVYDPVDIATYALSVVASVAIERWWRPIA